MTTPAPQPAAGNGAKPARKDTSEKDDEFEDFPAPKVSAAVESLWQETWEDDDERVDFKAQLEMLKNVPMQH